MSNSNNSDFKRLAAEADSEREKEMKTRKEAQLLKQEIDRQNNEDDENERFNDSAHLGSNASDITVSSKYSSRNSSVEPSEIETKIRAVEEKWKAAYGQLDAEKEMIFYQLCLVRDQIDDLNESHKNIQKELTEKRKENAYQKFCVSDLTNRINNLKSEIDIRDKLIVDNNLILVNECDLSNNAQSNQKPDSNDCEDSGPLNIAGTALLSKDIVEQLKELAQNTLECCITTLFDERTKYLDEIKTLTRKLSEYESESYALKDRKNKRGDEDFESLKQKCQNLKAQTQDYKRQLQLSQQKITGLEADVKSWENKVIRLDGQVKRYKTIVDSCEKQEKELKQTSRKYQVEARDAKSVIEDLKSQNETLSKKLEKVMKQKSKKEHE